MPWYSGYRSGAPLVASRDAALAMGDAYFTHNPQGAVQYFVNQGGGYWVFVRSMWLNHQGEWLLYNYPPTSGAYQQGGQQGGQSGSGGGSGYAPIAPPPPPPPAPPPLPPSPFGPPVEIPPPPVDVPPGEIPEEQAPGVDQPIVGGPAGMLLIPSSADTGISKPVVGALSGESAADAIFRQARIQATGISVFRGTLPGSLVVGVPPVYQAILSAAKSGESGSPIELPVLFRLLGLNRVTPPVMGVVGKRSGEIDPGVPYNEINLLGDEPKRRYNSDKCPCCALFWVHGWRPTGEVPSNFFELATLGLRAVGGCCDLTGVAWDAEGSPWLAADAAGTAGRLLAKEIERTHAECPSMRIDIAGHSMGVRVVLWALKKVKPGIVDNAYLLNAAVDWDVFENSDDYKDPNKYGNRGEFHESAQGAKNIFIFHSTQDSVLADIYPIYGYTALGLEGPKDPKQLPANVSAIDYTRLWGRDHHAVYYQAVSGAKGSASPFFLQYTSLSPGHAACCTVTGRLK